MRRAIAGFVLSGVLAVVLTACGSDNSSTDATSKRSSTSTTAPATMRITSPEFADGGTIPTEFTCAGAGNAPTLQWTAPPAGTKELALLVFDPDAGGQGFVHYLGWGIDPNARGAAENRYSFGALPGMNGLGREHWVPPCPPSGGPHRYQFTVFALSRHPEITYTANVHQFLDGIRGLVLAQGRLTGRYGR
ncbi:MAG: YbhB/YbcL family Raf kinase inhibitor-like protein [Acidimicrobiia bacterium]